METKLAFVHILLGAAALPTQLPHGHHDDHRVRHHAPLGRGVPAASAAAAVARRGGDATTTCYVVRRVSSSDFALVWMLRK